MLTKGEWLARQLQELEEQVNAERQRLQEARKRQALCAVLQLSLPELLGEIGRDGLEREPCREPTTQRMH
jgi:hypothetical protein